MVYTSFTPGDRATQGTKALRPDRCRTHDVENVIGGLARCRACGRPGYWEGGGPGAGRIRWAPPGKRSVAADAADIVRWVENNQHHWAGWSDDWKVLTLRGHGSPTQRREIAIPEDVWESAKALVSPRTDQFDNRMFRATPDGLALLAGGGAKQSPTEPEPQPVLTTNPPVGDSQ